MNIQEIGETRGFRGPSDGATAKRSGSSDLPVTVAGIEGRFVAVHGLWQRTPGGGASPFATDGPWHLMLREVGDILGTYSETLLTNEAGKELQVRKVDQRAPRTPLSVAEVGERDAVTAWLGLLDHPLDRKLVWLGTAHLARGEDAPGWTEIKRVTGAAQTPRSLAWRYAKAQAVMLCHLHGVPVRHAKVVAAGGVAALLGAGRALA